ANVHSFVPCFGRCGLGGSGVKIGSDWMSWEQLEPGTLLNDRYRILRAIGKGGMGTVYQAEHVRLDTILAVKEVRAPQSTDLDVQALIEQCQHEARVLVRLHHPNLPQVTDAFFENDRFYVVMEYIEGVT